MTASLNVILIGITSPTLYEPSEDVDVTDATVGTVVSMINALFAPSELVPPGLASVSVLVFPTTSLMVPLFNARALVLV